MVTDYPRRCPNLDDDKVIDLVSDTESESSVSEEDAVANKSAATPQVVLDNDILVNDNDILLADGYQYHMYVGNFQLCDTALKYGDDFPVVSDCFSAALKSLSPPGRFLHKVKDGWVEISYNEGLKHIDELMRQHKLFNGEMLYRKTFPLFALVQKEIRCSKAKNAKSSLPSDKPSMLADLTCVSYHISDSEDAVAAKEDSKAKTTLPAKLIDLTVSIDDDEVEEVRTATIKDYPDDDEVIELLSDTESEEQSYHISDSEDAVAAKEDSKAKTTLPAKLIDLTVSIDDDEVEEVRTATIKDYPDDNEVIELLSDTESEEQSYHISDSEAEDAAVNKPNDEAEEIDATRTMKKKPNVADNGAELKLEVGYKTNPQLEQHDSFNPNSPMHQRDASIEPLVKLAPHDLERMCRLLHSECNADYDLYKDEANKVQHRSVRRLLSRKWLNDEVIAGFIQHYLRPKLDEHSFICHSFFMSQLLNTGIDGKDPPSYTYSNVQRWFRHRDIFNLHNIYLSINHENVHWLTMRIDMQQKKISLWDSQGVKEANRFYFVNALRFLSDEYVTRHPHNTDDVKWMKSWSFEDLSNKCPQQENNRDCGIFHLLNLCLLVEGQGISKNSYSQESVDAKEVRKVIAHILWKADPNRPTV